MAFVRTTGERVAQIMFKQNGGDQDKDSYFIDKQDANQ